MSKSEDVGLMSEPTSSYEASFGLLSQYLSFADKFLLLSKAEQQEFIHVIEDEYDACSETELGQFLELLMHLLQEVIEDEEFYQSFGAEQICTARCQLHQDLQTLLDVCDLNQEMLSLTCTHLESCVN